LPGSAERNYASKTREMARRRSADAPTVTMSVGQRGRWRCSRTAPDADNRGVRPGQVHACCTKYDRKLVFGRRDIGGLLLPASQPSLGNGPEVHARDTMADPGRRSLRVHDRDVLKRVRRRPSQPTKTGTGLASSRPNLPVTADPGAAGPRPLLKEGTKMAGDARIVSADGQADHGPNTGHRGADLRSNETGREAV